MRATAAHQLFGDTQIEFLQYAGGAVKAEAAALRADQALRGVPQRVVPIDY
jgi:hypothetical protein